METPGVGQTTLRRPRPAPSSGHAARNSAQALAALHTSLDRLLASGGDPRLETFGIERLNRYGCMPCPRREIISFSSSTATSISERAYLRAARARELLIEDAVVRGLERAFSDRIEEMRIELKLHLGLTETGAEVVFSPSGTDSQLHALFVAGILDPRPLTTVIVGADQTGSGTVDTSRGRHFAARTAQGIAVEKGSAIASLGEHVGCREIALLGEDGALRTTGEMDRRVLEAIAEAVRAGSRVLLQIMDSSKLGLRSPSAACLDEITLRFPGDVQVVVDACQLRLGRARIKSHLARGFLVLVTGSKFFTGPPFSGAMLVPEALAAALSRANRVSGGLFHYSTRFDWPQSWPGIRGHFPAHPNAGQWLRWEAALDEMSAYYAVPAAFRRVALSEFGKGVAARLAASASLVPLVLPEAAAESIDDEELSLRTIFPFLIAKDGVWLAPERTARLYRALSSDMTGALPASARASAERICLIGQPVALQAPDGTSTAALRFSASARLVSESWSPDAGAARARLGHALDDVSSVIAKIDLLLAHPRALQTGEQA